MQAREWNQVSGNFTQIRVKLTWEAERASHSSHGCRNEMVQVAECWLSKLECTETNVVESLVVQDDALIGVLN